MRDLQVGDHVLVPAAGNALRYERVAMFYHREPETRVQFVRLETESGKILSLTALHLLPFGDCSAMQERNFGADGVEEWMRKARFAHKARVGDCVLSLDDQRNVQVERITKVGRELSKGIYSPVTVEGSIITNNILSSCFSQIESHAAQKMAFDALMLFYSSFGYLSNMAYGAVQEIPTLLQYFHTFSFYLLPFAKY
ncbi:hypothetical protein M3Y97_00512900 [Aphelenchoides bicaudatus]|nr:hypothetical protein M3Y97_00512900 [Aphelenchoides bicaudatus]